MLRSKTRWCVASLDAGGEERARELSRQLSLSPLVAKLLVQRGLGELETARTFLHGGVECLHDPFLLKGMDEAVRRIRLARERGEFVRIYGDYDADGVSSTALMTFLFRRLEMTFDSYIPHRRLEGYGLNEKAIGQAAADGVKLLVTVDTGVSAVKEIDYAGSLGIDVIVTDHHEPPHRLPAPLALINPKLEDCPYPFKGLAGVGVAFKLAEALLGEPPLEWTDIVALGTIADLMPLTDENRVLVRLGLEQLRRTDKPGLRALTEVAGMEPAAVNATGVAFGMAPRINAAGRIDHASGALRLLTASGEEEATAAAAALDALNRERQLVVEAIVEQARGQWEDKCAEAAAAGRAEPPVIVLAGVDWNAGVVGIVASKFVDRLYKPALILDIDPETGLCKGSARSIEGYDLHAALTCCEDLLDHYGGHQAAAGMTLHRNKLPELEERLGKLAGEWLSPEDWVPKTAIDLECGIADATMEVIAQLSQLEPFGSGNTAPKLLLKDIDLADKRTMGKTSSHLKLSLGGGGRLLDAVGFGFGHLAGRLSEGAPVELVGELTVNEWNGQRRAQFMLSDLRVRQIQLFDRRDDAGSGSLSAACKLLGQDEYGEAVALVPSAAWLEAAAGSEDVAKQLRIVTYDEAAEGALSCSKLLLVGRPPSADKLAGIIRSCKGLEAVYALYGHADREPQNRPDAEAFRPARGSKAARDMAAKAVLERAGEAFDETDRDNFGRLYQTLRRVCPIAGDSAAERLSVMMGWRREPVAFMLKVFAELEFLHVRGGQLQLASSPAKKELSHSPAYREALRRAESERILFAAPKELAAWIALQAESRNTSNIEGVGVS